MVHLKQKQEKNYKNLSTEPLRFEKNKNCNLIFQFRSFFKLWTKTTRTVWFFFGLRRRRNPLKVWRIIIYFEEDKNRSENSVIFSVTRRDFDKIRKFQLKNANDVHKAIELRNRNNVVNIKSILLNPFETCKWHDWGLGDCCYDVKKWKIFTWTFHAQFDTFDHWIWCQWALNGLLTNRINKTKTKQNKNIKSTD